MRIVVSNQMLSDARFLRLCLALGDDKAALGHLVAALRLCQSGPVDEATWSRAGLSQQLLDTGLFRVSNNLVEPVCLGEKRKRSSTPKPQKAPRKAKGAVPNEALIRSIFAAYPKRTGGTGFPTALKQLSKLSLTDLERFDKAVKNYADHCRREAKVGTSFVKMFSGFSNPSVWSEWVEQRTPVQQMKSIDEALAELNLAGGAA